MDLSLVILAAGIGSRYGGLKQAALVGPSGETILDYSIYDALKSGFDRVVLVVRPEIEEALRTTLGTRLGDRVPVAYVRQEIPEGREKPWGTGQAVLACRDAVDRPFAVLNADDFYGRASLAALAGFLQETRDADDRYAMVGFQLANTLSEHGPVSRGICEIDARGDLVSVTEREGLTAESGLDGSTLVSMNCWGFTPSLFDHLAAGFEQFCAGLTDANLATAEFYLPTLVNDLVAAKTASVSVLPTDSAWAGITNPDDLVRMKETIAELVSTGEYPGKLWDS